jgi:glyoxylase-like metal-dependent hydrolase (beta-lactamase superfamily II)/rhodanese-related sulfurtransferase
VLFRQFVDDDLGCASYLIGDETSGEAVIVDPAYAIEPYVEEAARRGARIVRVLETHTHADHVSGHGRLALEHGARVSAHPAGEPEYPFDPLADGDELELGSVTIRVLHTPGHRPEHCCFAVIDRSRGDEPWLVITGDSLLVGSAARPDLAVAVADGARDLHRSLRSLLSLGDGVEVYPGHVAGSLCGSEMSSKASTTIGFERRFNVAVTKDEDEFVAETSASSAPRPPNMERIVALNRGPFLGAPEPLGTVAEPGDAVVLDVRPAELFAAGHAPGALNVPVDDSSFPTKAAFVLPPGARVAIHAASVEDAERAARGLRAVGILELEGRLPDPPGDERSQWVELEELEALLADGEVTVLDVREKDERDEGYIAGSRHVPYRLVPTWIDDLRGEQPLVTICSTGSRAAIAASVLAAEGIEARPVLHGGVQDWAERGGETVAFRRCGG